MRNIISLLLLLLVLLYTTNVEGQDFDGIEVNIDALIPTALNDSTPGLVIGIVHGGTLKFSKGYGMANMSYGIPNDTKLVYNLGSVSKQFLGYAFAILHDKGLLNIDNPVTKYMEDWPEFKHTVTLRHLLTHTSGYREAYTMSYLAGRIIGVDRLSREECLDVVRRQPQLEFIPGSRYTYNSTAWVILAEILEKVTGTPADEWVEKNILQPLEMHDTQIESYVGEVIYNGAESYTYDVKQGYINQESNRAIFGAAEIYSSIQELVKWINNYRTKKIGGQKVHDLFLEPFILNDGTNSEYALGIGSDSYRGLKRYRHTGGHEAFLTQLSYYPEYDLGIITISNFGGKGWLPSTKIAELLLDQHMTQTTASDKEKIKIKKEKIEPFAGIYLAATLNKTINLTVIGDNLSIDGKTLLIPTSQNTFRVDGSSSQFEIENIAKEKTQLTVVNGNKNTYTKIEKWIPNEEDLEEFEGDYWSDELETIYHLKIKEGNLTIEHRWLGEISLAPISKDVFKSNQHFYIKFNRKSGGELIGLQINSDRTLNVAFQRKI